MSSPQTKSASADRAFNFDVFLSHNSGDKERVRLLARELKDAGLRVWFDEWIIKPGDDIYLSIESGLESSRVLILCLSPAALGSGWVDLERSTALFRDPANRTRRFIPALLVDCNLPDTLRRYRYIDFRQGNQSALKELLAAFHHEDVSPADADADAVRTELKDLTKQARRATRLHREGDALRLWNDIRQRAAKANLEAAAVTAAFEGVFVRMQHGSNLDEVLVDLDKCVSAASRVALGDERARMLQLLGEAHRIKRNWDQARGTLTKAQELARLSGRQDDEGWALLAMAALERDRGDRKTSAEHGLIERAYDCFSAAYVSGVEDQIHSARQGFANCHLLRAKRLGRDHFDEAMAEYARAIKQFEELGEDYQWNVADVYFERAELQSRTQEAQGAASDFIEAAGRFEVLEDRLKQARCLTELATLLDSCGLRTKSLPVYKEAVRIALLHETQGRDGWMWFRLGCKLLELGDIEDARAVFLKLLSLDHIKRGQQLV